MFVVLVPMSIIKKRNLNIFIMQGDIAMDG